MLLVTGAAGFIGSNVVAALNEAGRTDIAVNDIVGRVTSVAFSDAVGHVIGLAYVAPSMAEVGTQFDIKLSNGGGRVRAEVVPRPFYDADNARQKL